MQQVLQVLSRVLDTARLSSPDQRPLHAYALSPEDFDELEKELEIHHADKTEEEVIAAGFVLWAAEYIRAQFQGGALTWAFLFNKLGMAADWKYGSILVEKGFKWWGCKIRVSRRGIRMFLYSLMAEGGIPEALLGRPDNLYRQVVMGVLSEIEAEDGVASTHMTELIVARWIMRLPQTFRGHDFECLLIDFTQSIAEIRALLPADLPEAAVEPWLDANSPDWKSRIPLRITPQIAQTLIRPTLSAERHIRPDALPPLATRELLRDTEGFWHSYLVLSHASWLDVQTFPDADGLRLRLVPVVTDLALCYSATPENKAGWKVRRTGHAKKELIRFPLYEPFVLAAFADGNAKGEAIIVPDLLKPSVVPSFWKAAHQAEESDVDRLIPHSGGGQTRADYLWILLPFDAEPQVDEELQFDSAGDTPEGHLWKVWGEGELRVGGKHYLIKTQSEEEAPAAKLAAFGRYLTGWRLKGSVPIHLGRPSIYGKLGEAPLKRLSERDLRYQDSRFLGSTIVEWVQGDKTMAHMQYICLGENVCLRLREHASESITLDGEGLKDGWHVVFRAGSEKISGKVQGRAVRLELRVPGTLPSTVNLRLSEVTTGRHLELEATCPVSAGVILMPDGEKLIKNEPASVDALYGWRAVLPENVRGDLELRLSPQRPISLPISGEVSLTPYSPIIQAMLAQGDPDAQVELCVVVSGHPSRRLEVRRYLGMARIENKVLRAGFDRDELSTHHMSLGAILSEAQCLEIHAVSLNSPEKVVDDQYAGSFRLDTLSSNAGENWVIQSRINGQTQRAVAWSHEATFQTSRQERIDSYIEDWQRLMESPSAPEWDRQWKLIKAVNRGGDAGVLDQVQALAEVPAASICLALRVSSDDLQEALELDLSSPIFWPALPAIAFVEAVQAAHMRLLKKLQDFLPKDQAQLEADAAVAKRVENIAGLRPDLKGHFAHALMETGVLERISNSQYLEHLTLLMLPNPKASLDKSVKEAGQRIDRVPDGIRSIELRQPHMYNRFAPHLQKVIDAPFVTAEMVAGHRPQPDLSERLSLVNLRLVDPLYFDDALPAILSLYLEQTQE